MSFLHADMLSMTVILTDMTKELTKGDPDFEKNKDSIRLNPDSISKVFSIFIAFIQSLLNRSFQAYWYLANQDKIGRAHV